MASVFYSRTTSENCSRSVRLEDRSRDLEPPGFNSLTLIDRAFLESGIIQARQLGHGARGSAQGPPKRALPRDSQHERFQSEKQSQVRFRVRFEIDLRPRNFFGNPRDGFAPRTFLDAELRV